MPNNIEAEVKSEEKAEVTGDEKNEEAKGEEGEPEAKTPAKDQVKFEDGEKSDDSEPGVKPDWISEEHWDAKTGEVDVEKLATSEKEAKAALRKKNNVPEVTEDNPHGYDLKFLGEDQGEEGDDDFVEGLNVADEWINNEAFEKYAATSREKGASQDLFEFQMSEFFTWKENYDQSMGYDIDAGQEASDIKDFFVGEYGKKAEENFDATIRFMENDKNMHVNVAFAFGQTAEGMKYAHNLMLKSVSANPSTSDDTSVANVGVNADEIQKEIASLLNDPRTKLPGSDPERKQVEKELNEKYQQKAALGGGKTSNPALNPNREVNPNSVEAHWGPGAKADKKNKKYKVNR